MVSKPATLHVHYTYISLPSLHDYDANSLISRFIDDVNIQRQISLLFLNVNIFPKNLTPGTFAYFAQSEKLG